MDVHCGGFQGNDDRSDDDARRNGDPAHEQEFPCGFLYRCALERTGPDRGRESFLRPHGHAEANRPDAEPRAKGGVTTSDPTMAERDASVVHWARVSTVLGTSRHRVTFYFIVSRSSRKRETQ